MKNQFFAGVALIALAVPGIAFAQSTGSIDFDEDAIVVTATRTDQGVAGVLTPDTSKAKAVLTQDFIARQLPGQSINDIINQLPGVSFQNNDPFGSAGGKLSIRGFDNTRISQTFDGVPLNDSGNYALYSSQQLDSELIEQVNVNLGATDVDSPTAAASGSTVNYRTRLPTRDFSAKLVGAMGDFNFSASSARSTPVRSARSARAHSSRRATARTTMCSTVAVASTRNNITRASISRLATMAISSRSRAIGTKAATTSSARSRCAPTISARPWFRTASR